MMNIPKDFKLARTLHQFLEDSAGLVLGEFEVELRVNEDDKSTMFLCEVQYPGDNAEFRVTPVSDDEASVSLAPSDEDNALPMRVIFETKDDDGRLLQVFVYPMISVSSERYDVALELANAVNMRSRFGTTIMYNQDSGVHIQWKFGILFESELPSQRLLKSILEAGVMNVAGWWQSYIALASTDLDADEIIDEFG